MSVSVRGVPTMAVLAAAALTLGSANWTAQAADHLDPPPRTDPAVDTTPDIAADIADLYVWHQNNNLIVALTFAGPSAPGAQGAYDRDVLYTVHISNAGSPVDSEIQLRFRFGRDGNAIGVQVMGLPDAPTTPLVGPVETTLTRGGISVRAGVYDEPFFFDLQGFRDTRSTGTLMFDRNRNFFNGKNATAVVFQIPLSQVQTAPGLLTFWSTSARIGGQI